jgi:hypothetical protein
VLSAPDKGCCLHVHIADVNETTVKVHSNQSNRIVSDGVLSKAPSRER